MEALAAACIWMPIVVVEAYVLRRQHFVLYWMLGNESSMIVIVDPKSNYES